MKTYPRVLDKLSDSEAYASFCPDYAEPGYHLGAEKQGILFGDWNHVSRELFRALEHHFEMEWSDEWSTCDNCGRAIRPPTIAIRMVYMSI